MLVGVSKVAQSGFLSGLNNLAVYSMKDAKYQPFFGFTESEVTILLPDISVDDMDRVKKLYNGYIVPFRSKKKKEKPIPMSIFNPWSISSYKESEELESFWVNTSSTFILKDFLQRTMDIPKFNELI